MASPEIKRNHLPSERFSFTRNFSDYTTMESGVRAIDIITLLQERVAFLSGGRDGRGGPIISFPSTPKRERIKPEDLRRIISYLLNIPRFVAGLTTRLIYDNLSSLIAALSQDAWASQSSSTCEAMPTPQPAPRRH